ncbi:MAG: serine/threonine-protein kinase [Kofleriaceae bacterium]
MTSRCRRCHHVATGGRACGACGALLDATPVAAHARAQDGPAAALLGQRVDGMRIDEWIGRGQCGHVYRATQEALARPIALKVPTAALASDEVSMARFRREARALASVRHPGVVTIHAVGALPDGRPYLAMEHLAGESLEAVVARGPLPVARATAIACQIASALDATHARGLIHRDLKPSNVMLTRDHGGRERAVLIDFGIVWPSDAAAVTRLTHAGDLIGTPHYMSPEQVQGEDLDGRSDLYSLGVTLYRMLTGRTPFSGTSLEVVVAHVGQAPPLVRSLRPDVPEALERVVRRCLAKLPAQRFASAAELAHALGATLGGDGVVTDRTRSPTRSAPARWRQRTAPLGAVALAPTEALPAWAADEARRAPTRAPGAARVDGGR